MSEEIDVVIPLYNCEKFISLAIASALAQTLKPSRIIVIDDGSTDQGSAEVKRIIDANKSSVKIEYIYKANGGLSSARNEGIKKSTASFLAFLDSDDEWLPQKLRLQMDCFNKSGIVKTGLVYCSYNIIDEQSRLKTDEIIISPSLKGSVFSELLLANIISASGSGALIRRECFDNAGLFDESLRAAEDWDMWLRIAEKYEFDFVNQPLVNIRTHGSNMQKNADQMLINLSRFFAKWLVKVSGRKDVYKQWGHIIGEFILRADDKPFAKKTVREIIGDENIKKLYFRTFGSLSLYLKLKSFRKSINPVNISGK